MSLSNHASYYDVRFLHPVTSVNRIMWYFVVFMPDYIELCGSYARYLTVWSKVRS
ncbi:hypothetical protein PMI41_00872 [Phyllobacterium sp. YR531]|nr:hypothetical protein PMI41_00872 [Phyllobacterium sp. YR531]